MNGPDQVPIKVVKREISFSAAAKHDNIVQLLDVFAHHAQLVIVVSVCAAAVSVGLTERHDQQLWL